VARKPFPGTVAANVQEWGTGAINVEVCRIAGEVPTTVQGQSSRQGEVYGADQRDKRMFVPSTSGRWPANVILDGDAARLLDEQAGERPVSGAARNGRPATAAQRDNTATSIGAGMVGNGTLHNDTGGASRFFYVAKVSPAERNAGLLKGENTHPTLKPITLMRWLVRLITPPGGLVLDPFAGSGSTGCACAVEGVDFLGFELDPANTEIANRRIEHWRSKGKQGELL